MMWGVPSHLGQTNYAEICILVTKYISKLNKIQIRLHAMYLIACISVCAGSLRGCRERFRRTPSTCVCQAAAASSTNDDAIAVSSADFRNVSLSAWSKKVSRSPVTDTLCLLCPPPRRRAGRGHQAIPRSVCLSACMSRGAAALGTLAACSLATADGSQRCADCGPVRGRT